MPATCNHKLDRFDMIIDMAEIKHLSIKMKTTGKVKPRTLKKWIARMKQVTECSCKCSQNHLPDSVFPSKKRKKWFSRLFWWRCRKCNSSSNFIWEWEATEAQLLNYPENIRSYSPDEE